MKKIMELCVNQSTNCLLKLSYPFNSSVFEFSSIKQCYIINSDSKFNEIPFNSKIIQNNLLANVQYIFSLVILMIILLLLRRATASITKDDSSNSMTYLFKDLIVLLKLLHWKNVDYPKIAFIASCFLLFIVLLPLLLILWIFLLAYRQSIHHMIKKKYGHKFRGFLEGTDAVWALEDDSAKSVINIMALVEINEQQQHQQDQQPHQQHQNTVTDTAPVNILLALRKRFALRFLGEYKPFPKLFYKRCKEHGYSFWTNENDCTIEDYIRFMPDIPAADQLTNNKNYIEFAFGSLCNQPLPCNHSTSWEILVSKRHITDYAEEGESTIHIPVLFRIHHSLGDGVALLRLFLETIADREQPKKDLWKQCVRSRQKLRKYFIDEFQQNAFEQKFSIWKWMSMLKRCEFQRIWNGFKTFMKNFRQKLMIFVSSPASIVQQGLLKKIDKNCLHQNKLIGDKIVCWRFESDEDFDLLDTMKSIKRNFQGVRFSDVLLSALSISFQNYFEQNGEHIPTDMTVVLPARIEAEGVQLKLQNRFSVGLQTLPIRGRSSINRADNFHARMIEIKKHSDHLRSSPDYYVNFWIMSFLTSLLPDNILSSLIESVHSTIAVSNLPGPQTFTYINGYRISNMTFWLPHRGSTGIGISILSYGYKLQLGLIVDRAVISNQADAQQLLDNAVNEIRQMGKPKRYHLKRLSVGAVIDHY